MIYDISKREALEVLSDGLERFENNNLFKLSNDILDKCWEVTMYLKLVKPIHALGMYWAKDCRIEIYNHERGRHHDIRDTILHELAHHLAFTIHGWKIDAHGREWKQICNIIGCNDMSTSRGIYAKN